MPLIKYVTADGDKVSFTIKPCNQSSIKCNNGKVTFTIPAGVSMTGPSAIDSTIINVPVGFFNSIEKVWYTGDLNANTCTPDATFEFTVDDISLADAETDRFTILAVFTTSCEETTTADNTISMIIEVADECQNINLSIVASQASQPNLSIV